MIDTSKPVRFYDDRSKDKTVINMTEVLYQNERVCLCLTDLPEVGEVLFSLADGRVKTETLMFWYAQNV